MSIGAARSGASLQDIAILPVLDDWISRDSVTRFRPPAVFNPGYATRRLPLNNPRDRVKPATGNVGAKRTSSEMVAPAAASRDVAEK